MNGNVLLEPLISVEQYSRRVWQERDLNYLAPMPYSANWGQMGTFKTSTGLWLLEKKKVKNALIITSKVGKGAYFSDFYKCLPENWELYNVNINKTLRRIEDYEEEVELTDLLAEIKLGFHNNPRVLLLHFDVLTKRANENTKEKSEDKIGIVDRLKGMQWDMILIDEAHRIKNPKAQWTQNIKRLKAKNKHVMTGTGFVNNPAEIWSLLHFLSPQDFSSYWKFRDHFCDIFRDARGYTLIRGIRPGHVEEFRALRKKLGPRHTMREVHRSIDKPIETVREVELNGPQKRMYDDIRTTLQTLDQKGVSLQSPNVLSMLNRLRQISVATPEVNGKAYSAQMNRMVTDVTLVEPSSKLDEVMRILEELDGDEQIVVFSNFKAPLMMLERRLDKARIPYLHLQQHHSEATRYKLWHDEWPTKKHKVFMSTLALGGESINLSSAEYIIFLDRSWSPKDMMQAVGRVYRPGQKGAVEVIYINAKGTVDGYVKSKLDIKHGWFDQIFSEDRK